MKSIYWTQKFSKEFMNVHTHSCTAGQVVYTVCKRSGSVRALSISPSSAWAVAETKTHGYTVVDTVGKRSSFYYVDVEGACSLNYFFCLHLYFSRDMKRDYYFLTKDRNTGCFK